MYLYTASRISDLASSCTAPNRFSIDGGVFNAPNILHCRALAAFESDTVTCAHCTAVTEMLTANSFEGVRN
jgi:hypothetical protein